MQKPLESAVEGETSDYAKYVGCLTLKLNVSGQVGWPDRLYLYKGRVLFIEFKRQGEKPRKIQEYRHEQIRKQYFDVTVVDCVEQGYRAINRLTNDSPNL